MLRGRSSRRFHFLSPRFRRLVLRHNGGSIAVRTHPSKTNICETRDSVCSSPRLQISFDINKTIVMHDTSGGKGARHLCNEAIADSCWGTDNGEHWKWSGLPLSLDRPSSSDGELITFSDWATRRYPDTPVSASVDQAQARAASAQAKAARDGLRGKFCEAGGHAPKEIASFLPTLLDALLLPDSIRERDGAAAAGLASRKTWFLLPSWLAAIRHFIESGTAYSVRASLHFRTFGTDHSEVAREFNALASGRHPLHRDFRCDGHGGGIDRRIFLKGDGYGSYFRDSEGPILAFGLDLTCASSRHDALHLALKSRAKVAVGTQEIHNLLDEQSRDGRTLWIRDHWRHWRDCGEIGEAGKLLTFSGERGRHVLFVDDNARGPDGHILDVREGVSGQRLPWPEAVSRGFVQTAWPFAALTDDKYYHDLLMKAVRHCY